MLLTIAAFLLLTALAAPLARRRARRAEAAAEAPAAWAAPDGAGTPERPEASIPAMRGPAGESATDPAPPGLAQWPRETQT